MSDWLIRTKALYGAEAVEKFAKARVAVFGIGGVGGHTAEGLVRSGIGSIDIIDGDSVAESNLNRQIIASRDTVGKDKVNVMKDRILSINPECHVKAVKMFILPENSNEIDFGNYDYVVDAIDTVSGKMAIIESAKEKGVPVISAMGAGNKLDPTAFIVSDIYKTEVCPLAKTIRKLCRERGIDSLKVVYSKEKAITPYCDAVAEEENGKRRIIGSNAVVPAVAGLIIASQVLKDIAEKK